MLKDIKYMLEHLKPYRLRIAAAVGSGIMREICIMAAVGVCAYMAAFLAAGGHFRDWMYLEILAGYAPLQNPANTGQSWFGHSSSPELHPKSDTGNGYPCIAPHPA